MKWIKEMDSYNFLGIYDVLLDIKTEMNISPDRICNMSYPPGRYINYSNIHLNAPSSELGMSPLATTPGSSITCS